MTRPIETSRDLTLPFATDAVLKRRFMVVDEPLAGNIRFDLLLEVLDKLAVNVDADMIPRPVPPVYPTTYAEDARYLEAHRRNRRHDALRSTTALKSPAEEHGGQHPTS